MACIPACPTACPVVPVCPVCNEPPKPPRIPGIDCCGYYDKTHEQWRDYYPTCMGNNKQPTFPGNMLKDKTISTYDWYDSELYK